MSSNDLQDWTELYRAALLELDPFQLPNKIETAHLAIQRRINELLLQKAPVEEHLALEDALRNLRALKREAE
jgi:hypothetical protein